MTRAPRRERELRNAILQLLHVHGIAAWSTGVGAFPAIYNGKRRFVRVGTVGMSDIIGIVPSTDGVHVGPLIGRALFIEVKNPGGKVSPEQTAFLSTVVRAGGIGFVAHSVDEVMEKLGLTR